MIGRTISIALVALGCTGCLLGFDDPAVLNPALDTATDTEQDVPTDDEMDTPADSEDIIEEDGDITDADEPEAISCDPGGADDHCAGNSLMRCSTEGDAFAEVPCEDRFCTDDPVPRCADMGVHNVDDETLLCAGTTGLSADDIPEHLTWVTFLTDTGEIFAFNDELSEIHPIRVAGEGDIDGRVFTVQPQTGGAPELGILSLSEFSLPAAIGFFTIGARAAVILSCGPMTIAGAMGAAAIPESILPYTPGAAGGLGGTFDSMAGQGDGGGGAGSIATTCRTGGGGGGHGGTGGDGGRVIDTPGGAGGSVYGNLDLVPITAGSGGGAGGQPDGIDCAGEGGQGGGALLLASKTSIEVLTSGGIDSGGSAGLGGRGCGEIGLGGGGGGGGAGGSILLEAPIVTIQGYLFAAGGGGGAGSRSQDVDGHDGTNGLIAWGPAQGGTGMNQGAGGGWGGLPDSGNAENGLDADCGATLYFAGGGGGGDGIMHVNGMIIDISTVLLHPTEVSGLLTTGELRLL